MSTEDSEEVGSCNRPSAEAANLKPLVSAFLHPVRTDSCPASFAHFFSEVSVHPDITQKFLELAATDEAYLALLAACQEDSDGVLWIVESFDTVDGIKGSSSAAPSVDDDVDVY